MGREELRGVLHRLPATTRLPEVGGVGERFMICGCLPEDQGGSCLSRKDCCICFHRGLFCASALQLRPAIPAMCLSGSLKELYCPGCLR